MYGSEGPVSSRFGMVLALVHCSVYGSEGPGSRFGMVLALVHCSVWE